MKYLIKGGAFMDKILVDEEGYRQFYEELDRLKKTLLSNAIDGSEAYGDAVGDGWHDNFAFEETMKRERSIASRINKMLKEEGSLELIKMHSYIDEEVNIGDVVKLMFQYGIDDEEVQLIRVTGKYIPDTDSEIEEISLNSPLGKELYKRKINESFSYLVGTSVISIVVLEKMI